MPSGQEKVAAPPWPAGRSARRGEAGGDSAMKLSGLDLTCMRGGRLVFSGIGFLVASGQALVLTGPNGAGKSSLLRMVAGLVRPAAGRLVLDGGDAELSIGEQAHYVGHLDPLKPALTVTENLDFWARFLNGGDRVTTNVARQGFDTLAAALAAVGLAELASLPAGYLSAGQRRRLSLARILVAPRPIWLLDEPATALDAVSQERLRRLMQEHLDGGGIVVAATHGPLGLAAAGELRLGEAVGAAAAGLKPAPADAGTGKAAAATDGLP
jgi:heme exporter protein A